MRTTLFGRSATWGPDRSELGARRWRLAAGFALIGGAVASILASHRRRARPITTPGPGEAAWMPKEGWRGAALAEDVSEAARNSPHSEPREPTAFERERLMREAEQELGWPHD